MGQSTPTTTMALDTFEQRYAGYRSEPTKREQVWFDELVCRARRHSKAINRRRARRSCPARGTKTWCQASRGQTIY